MIDQSCVSLHISNSLNNHEDLCPRFPQPTLGGGRENCFKESFLLNVSRLLDKVLVYSSAFQGYITMHCVLLVVETDI